MHGPEGNGSKYMIPDIMYALVLVIVTLSYTYLFVTYHLAFVASIGFALTRQPLMIVMIVIAVSHNATAGFTSMLRQAIIHRSRALAGSDAKSRQINVYIRWFSRSLLWMFLNLCLYTWQYAVYALVISVSGIILTTPVADPAVRGMIVIVAVLSLTLTVWLLIQLIYGTLKRLGSYFPSFCCGCNRGVLPCFACLHFWWLPPIELNCRSYADAMNETLGQCQASFRLDGDGFCR